MANKTAPDKPWFFKEEPGSMTPESRIYIYATEMVSSYYSILDLNKKSVFTIIGSGDQILNAYFFGASEVLGFDINRRSPLFTKLKIQAIKSLTYDEFINFFGSAFNNGTFGKNIFNRFSDDLDEETRSFFNMVYSKVGHENPLNSEYFRARSFLNASAKDINAYLRDESSYIKMRDILVEKNPGFILGDIQEIVHNLHGKKFDIINLSNVPNYFVGRKEDRIVDLLALLQELEGLITKDGFIFYYSYAPFIYEAGIVPPASRAGTIDKIRELGIFKIGEKDFIGTNGAEKDKITILSKS